MISLDLARRMKPELDVSVPETGATQVHDPNTFGATGAGVLVASIDTGHDLKHADFRKADGTTRFKSVFNLDTTCSGAPPPGHLDGCYFDETQINRFLAGKSGLSYKDPSATFGHGSHTMGTAAGNGLATGKGFPAGRYVGMAPAADLIGVKLFDQNGNQAGDVTEALEFLAEEQARRGNPPLVVNMSFGHQFGAHDGTDPDELAIDDLADEGDANGIVRIFVKSAGNSELDGIYVRGTAAVGAPVQHTFTVPAFDFTGRSCGSLSGRGNDEIFADMWYEGADEVTVKITAPNGVTSFQNSTGSDPNSAAIDTKSGTIFVDCPSVPYPFNSDRECIFGVDDTGGVVPVGGTWTVTVTGVNITAGGRYDIWIADATKGRCTWGWSNPTAGNSISIPGTSERGITVGAYLTKLDWINVAGKPIQYTDPSFVIDDIAPFSSVGPTRDNRVKPDIAAPGMGIASTKAKSVSVTAAKTRIVEDGKHMVLEGTSMSAPHVAGAAALLLSINPLLDSDTIRQVLLDNATVDSFTSGVPNQIWGFGKLNVFAAANDPRVRTSRRTPSPGP
jgi:subtilisin family serine protease